MIDRYVAGFLFSSDLSSVVLILKTHPEWQAGKFNAVGGHISPDEAPGTAMIREFLEETGVHVETWKHFARHTNHRTFEVHWFWAIASDSDEIRTTTDEPVDWFSISRVKLGEVKTIPNVRWLIQMAINDVLGRDSCREFTIVEEQLYGALGAGG